VVAGRRKLTKTLYKSNGNQENPGIPSKTFITPMEMKYFWRWAIMVCSKTFREIPRKSFIGKLGRQYIKIFRKDFNSYRGDGTAAHARQLPGGTAATFRSLLIVGVLFFKIRRAGFE